MKGWRRAACLAAVLAGWVPAAGAAPGDWFVGWAVGSADGERATILSTTNGGTEWTNQGEGQVAAVALGGVASVGSRVWVVGAADIGYASIYCSTNDGADWARQGDAGSLPDAELLKCWAVNSQVVWAVGSGGTVVRTTNGGADWMERSVPGFTNPLQSIAAVDADRAWAGGHVDSSRGFAGLFFTTNGGVSWTQQTQGGITNVDHLLGLHAVDAQTVWGTGGPHQNIIMTTNGGAMWIEKHNEAADRDGNEICVAPDGTVWAATDSTIFWSTNDGDEWSAQTVGDFTMDVDTPDGVHIWAVRLGWNGSIYHSPDAGATWTTQRDGDISGLQCVSMQRRSPAVPAGTRLVWTNSPSPAVPYTTWETAAHDLQPAVDAAVPGNDILAAGGTYDLAAPVTLTQAVRLAAASGTGTVTLRGAGGRCLELSGGAAAEGLVLTNGFTSGSGGGARIGGGAVLRGCTVTGCEAGEDGGGIWLEAGGLAEGCDLVGNTAGRNGGGLYAGTGSTATHCRVAGNTAESGGGAAAWGAVLRNSLFEDNQASASGGGIHGVLSAILNCTVADNDAPAGGGLFLSTGGGATNCVAWGNTATNLFTGAGATWSSGLADADPEWIDPAAGDRRLTFGSPAIDAGASLTAVTNDLDGTARPLDGDGDGLAEYDLGCCEYDPDTADSNRDGVPDWWYRAHDLDPVSATVAQENADDDPVPNGNEWVALTDPRDGASWFRVERVARTGAVVAVGFSGAVQRVYSLWAREDLTAGDWTGVAGQTNVPGEAGGTTTLQDAADERLRLYRVEVAVP